MAISEEKVRTKGGKRPLFEKEEWAIVLKLCRQQPVKAAKMFLFLPFQMLFFILQLIVLLGYLLGYWLWELAKRDKTAA